MNAVVVPAVCTNLFRRANTKIILLHDPHRHCAEKGAGGSMYVVINQCASSSARSIPNPHPASPDVIERIRSKSRSIAGYVRANCRSFSPRHVIHPDSFSSRRVVRHHQPAVTGGRGGGGRYWDGGKGVTENDCGMEQKPHKKKTILIVSFCFYFRLFATTMNV